MTALADRYNSVLEKVAEAALNSGRSPGEIKLIVVTKNHPAQLVHDLISLGARDFGENRDQEASPKAREVSETNPAEIFWHFVGQLQTNKVKSVLQYASSIHSLDRTSLLAELEKRCQERSTPLEVFIEVNLTEDEGRGGVEPAQLEEFSSMVASAQGLRLSGLMGVARVGIDPRVDFERMAQFSSQLRRSFPDASALSMGMSGDYEAAISFGATHLRIGTAITGNRA